AGQRNTALFEKAVERLPLEELHHQIGGRGGLVDANVVQGDDGRIRELADYPRFLEESPSSVAVCQPGREEFDGHMPADQRVEAAHHGAMRALADRIDNLVATDFHGCPFSSF